jgi:hypothetical protein
MDHYGEAALEKLLAKPGTGSMTGSARFRRYEVLWIFNREKRQARELAKLAKRTILRMDELIAESKIADDKRVIERHREIRIESLITYERFLAGQTTDIELNLIHPLRYADISRDEMQKELDLFTRSAPDFATHLRAIHAA